MFLLVVCKQQTQFCPKCRYGYFALTSWSEKLPMLSVYLLWHHLGTYDLWFVVEPKIDFSCNWSLGGSSLYFHAIIICFVWFQQLLLVFHHHHIDMACNLLDVCGRYLYRSKDSHLRTKALLVSCNVVLCKYWRCGMWAISEGFCNWVWST